MSIKKSLLAAVAVVVAFAAVPAFASAKPVMQLDAGASPHFTVAGGVATLESFPSKKIVSCTSVTGTGEFTGIVSNKSSTGTIQLTFHGCKAEGTNCTTPGQTAGTIQTTALTFHLVTATNHAGVKKDGVLITPNNPDAKTGTGHFATFKCAFGLVHIEVKGTGIIGEITTPTNTKSPSLTVNFATAETGVQQYTTICDDPNPGRIYDLESSTNGGEWETATQEGEGTNTLTSGEGTLVAG